MGSAPASRARGFSSSIQHATGRAMMKRILALAAALFTLVPAQAAEEKLSIASLFKLPQCGARTIPPDGENIAALAPVKGRQDVGGITLENANASPATGATSRD